MSESPMNPSDDLLTGTQAPDDLILLVEALFLSGEGPLSRSMLLDMIGSETPPGLIDQALTQLKRRLDDHPFMALEETQVDGERGWRLVGTAALAPYLSRQQEPKTVRYSRAVLETLALIAWRQPITRGEIEAVRGVAVNAQILRLLAEREWIRTVGHKQTPGRPELLGTTDRFLADFGLSSLDQLPDFDQFVRQGEIDV